MTLTVVLSCNFCRHKFKSIGGKVIDIGQQKVKKHLRKSNVLSKYTSQRVTSLQTSLFHKYFSLTLLI